MDPLLGSHILRSSAEWPLRLQKPLLMRVGMCVSVFIGALCLLFSLLVLLGGLSPIFATQHLAGEYSGSLAILGILWGGMLLAIAYGFWKEKPWSRHLVIGYWLIGYLFVLASLWMYGDILWPVLMAEFVPHTIFLAIATWYFYLKPNVVDYYLGLDWWYVTEVAEAPRTEALAEEPTIEQLVAEDESIEAVTEVPRIEEGLSSLRTLADLARANGRFAEAERLYKRALAMDEEALEKDHLSVARDLNNLALFYDSRGNDAEAEPLYRRALVIAKKALGPDHPEVATVAANIEGFYEKTGRKAEPERLKERATEHHAILKRAGAVFISVGLMDVGYMFYSIHAGKGHASVFSIMAIIAGAFLLNGSLRAARIVATSAAFFVTVLLGVIIALPILLPVELILTYLKIAPLSDVRLVVPFLLSGGLSAWIYRSLTSPPVKAAMDEAGMNYKSFWGNPALGFKIGSASGAILLAFLMFSLKGERGARAIEEARKKMRSQYKYQVVSMGTRSSGQGTTVQAGVIAYDAKSIRYIDVAWKEQYAQEPKSKNKQRSSKREDKGPK